jgi:uncharacterized protein YbjT (DUF2867 family)
MRIVILGANGQVGRVVFQQCCKHFPQAKITGCVRPFHLHFEGCTGSKQQRSLVFDPFSDDWSVLGKVDALINCIGIIKEARSFTFEKAHTGLTRLIISYREMLGMPKIIQVSVLGADRNSPSRFMSTKAVADEELLKESNTCVVRPSIVCTHNTMMVQKLNRLGRIARLMMSRIIFPVQYLSTKIQPVMAGDVGDVIAKLAANEKTGIINVAGPDEIPLERLLKMLNKGSLKIVRLPQGLFNKLLPIARIVAPGIVSREQLMLLSKDNTADNTVSMKLLGRPMKSTLDFWKSELK